MRYDARVRDGVAYVRHFSAAILRYATMPLPFRRFSAFAAAVLIEMRRYFDCRFAIFYAAYYAMPGFAASCRHAAT